MSPLGEFNLSFLKNTRGANYFEIETEKSYDYFLIIGTFRFYKEEDENWLLVFNENTQKIYNPED